MSATINIHQEAYEKGERVLNPRKVVRKFDRECLVWHGVYGDNHDVTENGACVCCGAVEGTYGEEEFVEVAKFEEIIRLESEVQGCKVSIAFAPNGLSDWSHANRHRALENAQKALSDAVMGLTPEEGVAFGKYRVQVKKLFQTR